MSGTPDQMPQGPRAETGCPGLLSAGAPAEQGCERGTLRAAPQPSYLAERAEEARPDLLSGLRASAAQPVERPGVMLARQCGEAELKALADVARLTGGSARTRRLARLRRRASGLGAVLGAVCLVVLAPRLVLGAALVLGWLGLGAYAVLSHPRLGARVQRRWHGFARRRPASAERLRRLADAVAMRWEVLLDLLPEAWAEQLSPPDLSQPITQRGKRPPEG